MSRREMTVLAVTLLCGLLIVGAGVWVLSSANYGINWDVIGGGGEPISAASYTVNSTVGQATIGSSSSASYCLGAGYWYVLAAPVPPSVYTIYLPIILKNYP
jgi:hypothetical protein